MRFFIATLALIPLGWIPGFSGMFLLEAAVALILVAGAATLANAKGLLPGTASYNHRLALEQAQNGLELDRISRTRTRIKLLENDDINRIIALPPAQEDSE